MKKNHAFSRYIWLIVLILFTLVVAAIAAYFLQDGFKDYIGAGVAVIIIFCTLAAIGKSIVPMLGAAATLDAACSQIENTSKVAKSKAELFDMLGVDLFEKDKALSACWLSYKRQVLSSTNSEGVVLDDIQDYFNEDMVNADIAKIQIFDMLPGLFTGLGILGTFVGLMYGLQAFRIDNADAMLATIPTLIDGIKIAFTTSIYGITMSLVYNLVEKNILKHTILSLNDFIDCYHGNVFQYSDYRDALVKIVDIENRQVAAFDNFTIEFTRQLAESLNTAITPTINQMQLSMDRFMDVAAKSQVEGLERIVDKFVISMDRSMGNRFERFGRTIDDLSTRQKETANAVEDAVAKLLSTTSSINTLNGEFSNMLNEFQSVQKTSGELMQSTRQGVDAMFAACNDMQQGIQGMHSYLNSQQDYFSGLARMQKETFEQCRMLLDGNAKLEQIVNEITEKTERQYQSSSASSEAHLLAIQQGMADQTASLNSSYEALTATAAAQLAGIQASMLDQAKTISDSYAQLQSLTASVNKDISQMNELMRQSYTGMEKNIEQSFMETFSKFDSQLAGISTHLGGTLAEIRDVTDEIPEILHESFKVFEDELRQTSKQIAADRRNMQ